MKIIPLKINVENYSIKSINITRIHLEMTIWKSFRELISNYKWNKPVKQARQILRERPAEDVIVAQRQKTEHPEEHRFSARSNCWTSLNHAVCHRIREINDNILFKAMCWIYVTLKCFKIPLGQQLALVWKWEQHGKRQIMTRRGTPLWCCPTLCPAKSGWQTVRPVVDDQKNIKLWGPGEGVVQKERELEKAELRIFLEYERQEEAIEAFPRFTNPTCCQLMTAKAYGTVIQKFIYKFNDHSNSIKSWVKEERESGSRTHDHKTGAADTDNHWLRRIWLSNKCFIPKL